MIDTLKGLGLSRKEAECYIGLLELGSTRTGPLIRKTGIPSSKIYETLEKLIGKGLATYVIKENVKHFQAADPKTLVNLLEEKKKQVETIVPQLLAKQHTAERQGVEMFEGKKAVLSMFTNMIAEGEKGDEYLIFSIADKEKDQETNRFLRTLTLRRKEKGLDVKLLKNKEYYKKEKHTKLQLRYTDFKLPQGITIFKDSVILLSWSEEVTAIKIDSKQYAGEMKTFFHELWEKAKA